MCRRLELSERPAAVITLAVFVHDVGKLAIPRRILDHPWRLAAGD